MLAKSLVGVKAVVAIGLLLAAVVIFAVLRYGRPAPSVTLTNGHEVALGEPVMDVQRILGNDNVEKAGGDIYLYPAGASGAQPLEAIFYAKNNRVVAVRQPLRHTQPNLTLTELKNKYGTRLQAIDQKLSVGSLKGYRLEEGGTVTLYLIDPCDSPEQVVAKIVADKGQESLAYGSGVGCNVHGD
jgi:hypothetical protein